MWSLWTNVPLCSELATRSTKENRLKLCLELHSIKYFLTYFSLHGLFIIHPTSNNLSQLIQEQFKFAMSYDELMNRNLIIDLLGSKRIGNDSLSKSTSNGLQDSVVWKLVLYVEDVHLLWLAALLFLSHRSTRLMM